MPRSRPSKCTHTDTHTHPALSWEVGGLGALAAAASLKPPLSLAPLFTEPLGALETVGGLSHKGHPESFRQTSSPLEAEGTFSVQFSASNRGGRDLPHGHPALAAGFLPSPPKPRSHCSPPVSLPK
uniref:Uncharacterized protein n=1 Tax=Micrurus corallinus TaxID=54390 RepID=A0A2D4G8H4_MICCO